METLLTEIMTCLETTNAKRRVAAGIYRITRYFRFTMTVSRGSKRVYSKCTYQVKYTYQVINSASSRNQEQDLARRRQRPETQEEKVKMAAQSCKCGHEKRDHRVVSAATRGAC